MRASRSEVATASNYPSGRHSKDMARTAKQNGWQRLKFLINDRIDGETYDNQANQIVLMLNPNSNTGDTYYLDNDAIYSK